MEAWRLKRQKEEDEQAKPKPEDGEGEDGEEEKKKGWTLEDDDEDDEQTVVPVDDEGTEPKPGVAAEKAEATKAAAEATKAAAEATKAAAEAVAEAAAEAMVMDEDVDPLEAFMVGVQEEVKLIHTAAKQKVGTQFGTGKLVMTYQPLIAP